MFVMKEPTFPLNMFLPPLTAKDLEKMLPNQIFFHGKGLIVHPWFNHVKTPGVLEADGRHTVVKFVAATGAVNDWAIYHSLHSNLCQHDYFDCSCHLLKEWGYIYRNGQKVYDTNSIKNLVPCTKDALARYRM